MAKQKFQCKGVVRKTGQRVAVEVSAESKEAAIKLAAEHGVAVEQIVPVSSVAQPPSAAPSRSAAVPAASSKQDARAPADEDADESVDNLLGSSDDDLDDLDLGDDAGAPPTPSGQQATKACPYCGEQVLAVAIKCKHCGSYLAEIAPTTAQPILTPMARPKLSRAKASRLWLAIGSAAVLVALIVIGALLVWPKASPPRSPPLPVVESKPTPPPVVAKPAPPKHSPEELAFAAKLVAYLDACDQMAKLLQGVSQPEKCAQQTGVIRDRWAEVPPPPSGVAWAADAADSARHFVELAEGITGVMRSSSDALDLIGGGTGDNQMVRDASRKAADQIRGLVKKVRDMIPPDCLPKSG